MRLADSEGGKGYRTYLFTRTAPSPTAPPLALNATRRPRCRRRPRPAPGQAQRYTRRICVLLPKQMATQSGSAEDHCSWLTSLSAP